MQIKWLGIFSAVVLIAACFFPWITIPVKGIVVTGVDATGTAFGKPGYMHLLLAFLSIPLFLIRRTLALRVAIFITGFNAAWSIRNLLVIAACHGGICPEKQPALYVIVISSIVLFLCNMFTGTKEKVRV